jgi:ABC-type phosphate transport system substrate-binding protein
MLGTPARRVALTVALTLVPASALAVDNGADAWTGKVNKTTTVQIVRADSQPGRASASISYSCTVGGVAQSWVASLSGKVKHNKINFKGSTNGAGKASLKATLSTPKAKGKIKVSYPNSDGTTCKVSGKFKAKHTHVTGG